MRLRSRVAPAPCTRADSFVHDHAIHLGGCDPVSHCGGCITRGIVIPMTLRKYITNFMLISAVAFSAVAVAPLRAAQAAPTDGVSTGIALDAGPVTASVRASSTLAWLDRYSTTLDPRAFTAFSAGRDALAADIATQLMIDPARMQAAWAGADIDHQVALMTGLSQLGVPYRRNTSKPGVSFDCSGLTTYAWSEAGYALARNSRAQINASAGVVQ